MDGRRVLYALCSLECRRDINPSLVKGLILYLEAVVPTYLRDLNPKGLIGLCHLNVITVLLGLFQFFFKAVICSFEVASRSLVW